VRSVVPIRLSDAEREQIQAAAGRLELTLSGFIRKAALQASAVVGEKISVQAVEPEPSPEVRDSTPFVLLDTERPRIVDGMASWPTGVWSTGIRPPSNQRTLMRPSYVDSSTSAR
jgi:mobilization protein NikA